MTSTRFRLTLALGLAVSFAIGSAISLGRWDRAREEIQPLKRARIDQARELTALRIERLPTCVWVRDLLKTKVASSRFEYGDAFVLEKWLAFSCLRHEHVEDWSPSKFGTVGELAERLDASFGELADEVTRLVP